MRALPDPEAMYAAVCASDRSLDGAFVFAVQTTGVFCRPSCGSRLPKRENVRFFGATRDALQAGFRACKKCRPLDVLGATPDWLRPLIDAVETEPERRWSDADLRARTLEPARVRRWFQQHHAMTFHAYSRARRLGSALGRVLEGGDVLAAGAAAGFESESGFRDAFAEHFGKPPGRARSAGSTLVCVRRLTTPLGPMIAAATSDALCLLEFTDRTRFSNQVERIRKHFDAQFAPGDNDILQRCAAQLAEYFAGLRRSFELPLRTPGTPFQEAAWNALHDIPYGSTRSYADQAAAIGRPSAVRAIGRANGDNRISIVIPCHRVIAKNGALTGYGGLVWRKQALLELEQEDFDAPDSSEPPPTKTTRPPHEATTGP